MRTPTMVKPTTMRTSQGEELTIEERPWAAGEIAE